MTVFVNGEFVPDNRASVSVFDRGFLLGDGLFETLLVRNKVPFRWAQHAERLQRGAAVMWLPLPMPVQRLREMVSELLERNRMTDAVLRITVSRGPGPRGYSIAEAGPATVVAALHPAPPLEPSPRVWRLATASVLVVPHDPLASVKTCSKAWQVAARAEAEARGADEALLLNTAGHVAEAAGANLFWIEQGRVCTPPLSAGVLPGITRAVVLELCANLGIRAGEESSTSDNLLRAEGVFLTLSTRGIVEVSHLDDAPLRRSSLVSKLQTAYHEQVALETDHSG